MVTLKDKRDSLDDDCKTKGFEPFYTFPSQSIDTWKVTQYLLILHTGIEYRGRLFDPK